ncbi:MAG: nitroreductase [Acidimicrobiales bacterium]|nr:nitroreductase [Acidimicrobiales bacterium]
MTTGDAVDDRDVFGVLDRQRACREFTDADVADDLVERVLRAATRAPSAENSQPWVFVVVRDAATRGAIGELMRRAWEGGARRHSEGRLAPALLADVDRGATGSLARAPVHVVVGADMQRCLPQTVGSSIFPAVQNLLLAATAHGLGSVLTTLATTQVTEIRRLTNLPATVEIAAVIPLGWPAHPPRPGSRRPLSEVAFRETADHPWSR